MPDWNALVRKRLDLSGFSPSNKLKSSSNSQPTCKISLPSTATRDSPKLPPSTACKPSYPPKIWLKIFTARNARRAPWTHGPNNCCCPV